MNPQQKNNKNTNNSNAAIYSSRNQNKEGKMKMKMSLSNVRFAIKTTSVTLPSITGRYRCTTQADRDSEFRECFKRCHKFTMRSVWMNEWT